MRTQYCTYNYKYFLRHFSRDLKLKNVVKIKFESKNHKKIQCVYPKS